MGQAEFPPGISTDIPPEKSAGEKVLDALFKEANDFIAGMEKVNDFASAGRWVDCEH